MIFFFAPLRKRIKIAGIEVIPSVYSFSLFFSQLLCEQVELPGSDTDKDEAKPPEPFEWSPDMQ